MKAGDTFRPADRSADIHLWVVISNPSIDPDRILIVSLTTYKPYKENACLLDKGDHCSISHPTCIAYYAGTEEGHILTRSVSEDLRPFPLAHASG